MDVSKEELRARIRAVAVKFIDNDDPTGWFEAVYQSSNGNPDAIPWTDLEPNRFFREWAEKTDLVGNGRKALVIGCGLGDDAKYLDDLGFSVTAFDISPTAIEWAKRLHSDTDIVFQTADLLIPFRGWLQEFDFVLEVYTIQPLPLDIRPQVIDAISSFVANDGRLVVVTRGRADDDEPTEMPWPVSRRDLSRFLKNGLRQIYFVEMPGDDEEPPRFVVEYIRDRSDAN